MKAILTLARKDLRLLLRDPRAAIILLAMPFVFILVLGLSLGEGFGHKPDDRLRVSIVDLDEGFRGTHGITKPAFPDRSWSKVVIQDLAQTAGIRIELIPTREEAQHLVEGSKRAAVIVFGPDFSERVWRCSFLADGINPFFRDGVNLEVLDAGVLRDETQLMAVGIIQQVAQGSLLRVVMPWMIGQAFEKIGQPDFIDRLSKEKLEVKVGFMDLKTVLKLLPASEKRSLAAGLQQTLQGLFPNYNLTAKTWASLTRSEPHQTAGAAATIYQPTGGEGLLHRGALRYQLLVPSYTVMFAFFLVLTVGWLFVAERRQGTLKRLCVAPLSRTQILAGKMLPCLFLSLSQGLLLLLAGKVVFAMSWGPEPQWLLLVVFCTSLAAMGLALLVASLAQSETQVAIYGTLLVLVLAGLSGCLMGDRSLMPERMQDFSRITPHAWALDAYRQLLANPGQPNLETVAVACGVLTLFGIGFTTIAWSTLKLEG